MQRKNESRCDSVTVFCSKGNVHSTLVIAFLVLVSSILMFAIVSDSEDSFAAPDGGNCGFGGTSDLQWAYDGVDTLTISGTGDMENYTIGSSPWHAYNSAIQYLILQEGLTSIGDWAFSGSSVRFISMPTSLLSIGECAFSSCPNLASVIIPENVTSIGWWAFSDCSSLTSAVIPGSVSIIEYTFQNSLSLESVIIHDGLTTIGIWTFFNCPSLTSVIIPNSVTTIGNGAFGDCSSLAHIDIPDSVIMIDDEAFSTCSSMTSIVIPSSVTSVGVGSFFSTSLTDLTLTGSSTAPNMSMSNGVLVGNELDGMTVPFKTITLDGTVDLTGLTGTPTLIFADGVDARNIPVTSATSDIVANPSLDGCVYTYDTLASKWVNTAPAHTVTFVANGGSCIPRVIMPDNESIILPTPVKAGSVFDGWYTSSDFSTSLTLPYFVSSDLTLYAKYTEKTYTILYDENGGISPAPVSDTVSYSGLSSYSLRPSSTFTPPTGMEFSGWVVSCSRIYDAGVVLGSENICGDVTVFASWSPYSPPSPSPVYPTIKYVDVNFNSNGGSHVNSITVKYGQTYGNLPTPQNEGFEFCGWYLDGKLITGSSTVNIRGDHTLDARWDYQTDAIIQDDSSRSYDPLIVVFAASSLLLMMLMVFAYVKVKKD